MHATTSAAQWREAVCTVLQWSRVERRGHIPVLQLLLRPTAGSSQPFQEDPHDCDDEEEKIRMIVMMKRRERRGKGMKMGMAMVSMV